MKLIVIAIFAALTLIGCGKGQEIQLLSEDNSHMLYLYPEDGTAEIYTGMSMLADYNLSKKGKIYTLVPNSNAATQIELTLDANTSNWACRGCVKGGLSSQWIQQ